MKIENYIKFTTYMEFICSLSSESDRFSRLCAEFVRIEKLRDDADLNLRMTRLELNCEKERYDSLKILAKFQTMMPKFNFAPTAHDDDERHIADLCLNLSNEITKHSEQFLEELARLRSLISERKTQIKQKEEELRDYYKQLDSLRNDMQKTSERINQLSQMTEVGF